MKKIMKGLRDFSQITDEKDFPDIKVLTFLAKTCLHNAYFPNNYLYPFEIKRVTFTTLGTLQKTNDDIESKFLVAMFFIFRGLIRDILLNPHNVYPDGTLTNNEVM